MTKKEVEVERVRFVMEKQLVCGTSKKGHSYCLISIITYKDLHSMISHLMYKCSYCGLTYAEEHLSRKQKKALKLFGYTF